MQRDLVAAVGQLGAEQLGERVVGELGLLQADDVRLPLVQPGQEPRAAAAWTELTFQVATRTDLTVASDRRVHPLGQGA